MNKPDNETFTGFVVATVEDHGGCIWGWGNTPEAAWINMKSELHYSGITFVEEGGDCMTDKPIMQEEYLRMYPATQALLEFVSEHIDEEILFRYSWNFYNGIAAKI